VPDGFTGNRAVAVACPSGRPVHPREPLAMRRFRLAPALLTLLLASMTPATRGDDAPRYARRWVYVMTNLQVNANADKLIALIERSAKAGFNGLVLADYKLNVLDRVTQDFFKNLARVQKVAGAAGVELIPAVFPIGYSDGLLAHDPNLAEGVPVDRAPFVVRGRQAVLDPRPAVALNNGDLEESTGDRFPGFGFQDEPGGDTFADANVAHHGCRSCRMAADGPSPNRRLVQQVPVRPHACYRISAWVKTAGLSIPSSFRLLAISAGRKGGRSLTFAEGGIEPTQDWKRIEVVFNSLDHDAVNVYAGLWGQGKGTLWIDELAVEELGLVNVLRRPGCPLTVTSDDGRTVYIEGRDFEPVADPKLGQVPFAGEYDTEHAPAALRITPRSRIRDGQRLRVSWYHPILTVGGQVMCCPSEPKTYELLRVQARKVNDLMAPRTFFMSHDEIRVLNWCKACTDRHLTPGQILADNVKRCVAILHDVNPKAEIITWSDMFDPNHNAVKEYYLVNGTLEGSWEGLPSSVTIANWNGGKARPSLEFFAGRGHRQLIAGYYDVDDLSGFTPWDAAAKDVKGVDGFMYTTWSAKFKLLEEYGRAMRAAR
jgi:hypothetical protein